MINRNIENNPLVQKFFEIDFFNLSKEAGFTLRQRKASADQWLLSFFALSLQSQFSFSNWAIQLSLIIKDSISKQGLWKRLNQAHRDFLESVLKKVISQQIDDFSSQNAINKNLLFNKFGRVLIQDSTTIRLPVHFNKIFPGNRANGSLKSLLKIQAIINLKNHHFPLLEVNKYKENDQKFSSTSASVFQKGDLIIRDLGYFVLKNLSQITQKGAFYISKLRYGVNIYDQEGSQIDLLKVVKNKSVWEQEVYLGKQKIKTRITVFKVSEATAEKRRRKAKNDRDKRLNHSKKYYQLLGYDILISNVETEILSAYQVKQAYALRWRIETIFKTWKSHLNLQKRITDQMIDPEKILILIHYTLIFITVIQTNIFFHFWWRIYNKYNRHLSLTKFTQFIADNLILTLFTNDPLLIEKILYQACTYETRKTRLNFSQKTLEFNLS